MSFMQLRPSKRQGNETPGLGRGATGLLDESPPEPPIAGGLSRPRSRQALAALSPVPRQKADARRGDWRQARVGGLALVDGLLALLVVTATAGRITGYAVVVSLVVPIALATVGAYRKAWSQDTTVSAMLARLLFAAILSMWVALVLVDLIAGARDLAAPLVASGVLPLMWLLTRSASGSPVAEAPLRVVIVGTGAMLEKLLATPDPRRDREVLGYFVSGPGFAPLESGRVCLGGCMALPNFLAAHPVDRVVIAGLEKDDLGRALRACDAAGAQIEMHVPGLDGACNRTHLSFVNGVPMLRVREEPAPQWSYAVKRAIDVVGASLGLLILAPALAVVALGARITQGGPVLFRQWRVGRHGRPFEIIKFRTMSVDAEVRTNGFAAGVATGTLSIGDAVSGLKHAAGSHVTKCGAFLRATSLDELPQLWNVLRGDMSLVGPRPLRHFEHAQLEPAIAERRSRMRPGMTGLWQVRGRSNVSWDERIKLDDVQVRNWTLRDDAEILIETVPALFSGR
jgi:exopolysaccharide biosynthesis polyprenyl glycosylphosphotransferase